MKTEKEYALDKWDSVIMYLTMQRMGTSSREQSLWDSLNDAIFLCTRLRKEVERG
jgi:hypothetical protein